MNVTYSAEAWVQNAVIAGVDFQAGETKDVPDDIAAVILKNPNFTDKDGRNAYSDPLPDPVAAAPIARPAAQPAPVAKPPDAPADDATQK